MLPSPNPDRLPAFTNDVIHLGHALTLVGVSNKEWNWDVRHYFYEWLKELGILNRRRLPTDIATKLRLVQRPGPWEKRVVWSADFICHLEGRNRTVFGNPSKRDYYIPGSYLFNRWWMLEPYTPKEALKLLGPYLDKDGVPIDDVFHQDWAKIRSWRAPRLWDLERVADLWNDFIMYFTM